MVAAHGTMTTGHGGEYAMIQDGVCDYLAMRDRRGTTWRLSLVHTTERGTTELLLVSDRLNSLAECEDAATEDAQERELAAHPNA